MPILYIFAAIQATPINDKIRIEADKTICQTGTPKATRAGIIIGDEKGTSEAQKANGPEGSSKTFIIIKNETIIGKVTGRVID